MKYLIIELCVNKWMMLVIQSNAWNHLTLMAHVFMEKKLDGNYIKILRAILNKSWWQHPTKHQLYGHLPPITKTIKVRRTRLEGHCWRSRDELISDVLLWTPSHGRAKAGWPARTYIQQRIRDVALRTWQKRWRIGRRGKNGSRISVLVARQDEMMIYV